MGRNQNRGEIGFFVIANADYPYDDRDLQAPGSVIVKANCGHLVWLSPDGQRFSQTGLGAASYTICFRCSEHSIMHDKDAKKFAIPGMADTVRRMFGDAEVDQFQAFLRDTGIVEL